MAKNWITLEEWFLNNSEEDQKLKLAFLEKEASTPHGLLAYSRSENNEKFFINRTPSEHAPLPKCTNKKYSIEICPLNFKKIQNKFRTFKYEFRNKKDNRVKIQLTLNRKTFEKISELPRIMNQKNLNDCLSELIDFYNKNKSPRLKNELIIKAKDEKISYLEKEFGELLEKNLNYENKSYLENKSKKQILYLQKQLAHAKAINKTFDLYKMKLDQEETQKLNNIVSNEKISHYEKNFFHSIEEDLKNMG